METSVVFSGDMSKDIVGQYYGYNIDLFYFVDQASRDYRKAVFGVLDVISSDSLSIIGGQHLSQPVLSLSARVNGSLWFEATDITYVNGTRESSNQGLMGAAEIYRASIRNLITAVAHAVYLDLGSAGVGDAGVQNNIFLNESAVGDWFVPNLAPIPINPDSWVDFNSFYYGTVVAPYQTWAQMLLAGLPSNVTLGNLTGLPNDSAMVTSYLCPSYKLKRTSSFLSSIFVGTATMYLSVWATWAFATALIAKQIREPCRLIYFSVWAWSNGWSITGVQCTCGALLDGEKGDDHHFQHQRGVVASGLAAGLVPPPPALRADSTNTVSSKENSE
jgi:hypothetical protein